MAVRFVPAAIFNVCSKDTSLEGWLRLRVNIAKNAAQLQVGNLKLLMLL